MLYRNSSISATSYVVGAIITLILVIILYIFILPDSKRQTLNKFFGYVYDFLKIKKLMLESLVRFIYVFDVIYVIVLGFITIFNNFGKGLLMILLGPIVCRIIFESLLLGIILVKNVMDINNFLRGVDASSESDTQDAVTKILSSVGSTISNMTTAPKTNTSASENSKTSEGKVCSHCGNPIPDEAAFCVKCGQPVE